MNYEEFKESVKNHILEYLPESYTDAEVMIHSVVKNNSVHLDGLMFESRIRTLALISILTNTSEITKTAGISKR